MPIYQRWIFNKYSHAGPLFYGALIHLSMSYSPLIGKLHTRYSPVRRSPAMYCYTPLPLDLHVLSLSLAFILSQDQTLRCYLFLFSFSLFSLSTKTNINFKTPADGFYWRRAPALFLRLVSCRIISMSSISLKGESGYKGTTFLFNHQIFRGKNF